MHISRPTTLQNQIAFTAKQPAIPTHSPRLAGALLDHVLFSGHSGDASGANRANPSSIMAAQPLSLAEFPRKAARIRAQIQAYEPELQALTNAALKSKREELRLTLLQEITRQRFPQEAKAVAALDAVRDKAEISARLAQLDPTSPADQEAIGKALESIEPLAFAVAGEACRRTLGKKPYGASMQFWEGRALATVLPAYLLSLTGNGVYLKQHNDYLAQRDVKTLRPILETLGLSVATATHHTQPGRQKQAYNANITYGSVPLRHDQVLGNLPTGKKWYVVDY